MNIRCIVIYRFEIREQVLNSVYRLYLFSALTKRLKSDVVQVIPAKCSQKYGKPQAYSLFPSQQEYLENISLGAIKHSISSGKQIHKQVAKMNVMTRKMRIYF